MSGRRIVLLEMATEDAEEFVRDTVAKGTASNFEAAVAAVVAKPQKWCRCDVPTESRSQRRKRLTKRESGWMRGTTLGWWICASCKKPSKAIVLHFVTTMLAGANDLLPRILDADATPLSPRERWRDEGGIPNDFADARPAMPFADSTPKRRRKPRRSEVDRIARQRT